MENGELIIFKKYLSTTFSVFNTFTNSSIYGIPKIALCACFALTTYRVVVTGLITNLGVFRVRTLAMTIALTS